MYLDIAAPRLSLCLTYWLKQKTPLSIAVFSTTTTTSSTLLFRAVTSLFLDKVLEEIAALFPAPYVHIGADEVPNGVWSKSPACQALMEKLGYTDYKELQGHFLRHAEDKLRKLGKRMLGWEEAQHGNKVSKDTVIYSWLSEEAALNCARQGFDVSAATSTNYLP